MMTHPEIHIFSNLQGEIGFNDVAHLLGYRKRNIEIPDRIKSIIEEEIKIGGQIKRPKGIWRRLPINIFGREIDIAGKMRVHSEKLSSWVEGCNALYLFAVTAGPLFKERVGELLKLENVSRAMITDAVGSACAESCAQQANHLLKQMNPDLKLTKRYSPGYGDWDVMQNREPIALLQGDRIGITVNESGLMQPEKSVSAVIGIRGD